MPRVRFTEVGRNKATWEAECKGELTKSWLYKQAKKALMSSGIEFIEFEGNGVILAGFRSVGRFEIIEGEI
jgi:hypothetical protein